MTDQLDKEMFECDQCKGQFRAIDGTWPKRTWSGDWIVTYDKSDEEQDHQPTKFVCYDCAP